MDPASLPDDVSRIPIEPERVVLPWPERPAGHGGHDAPAALAPRELTQADLVSRRGRRVFLPLMLFVATCFSTFVAGALDWKPDYYLDTNQVEKTLGNASNVMQGLIYMAAVIGILLTHEMGHFLQAARYHVPASLPYFIPLPILMTGTMGAVIGMEGSRADRKQLFDIGISGPWAGLIVSLPIIWFGIKRATIVSPDAMFQLGDPLIFKLLAGYLRPDIPAGAVLNKDNALLMAGWVGMLITGLNMLPISQLDGGHVIYGLFGPRAYLVSRTFLIASIAFIVLGEHYNWTLMLVLVIFLGVDHPPTRNDNVPLGFWRRALGLVSLGIPVLCFTPVLL